MLLFHISITSKYEKCFTMLLCYIVQRILGYEGSFFLLASPPYRVRPLRKACVVGKQGTADCLALSTDPRDQRGWNWIEQDQVCCSLTEAPVNI